MATQVEDLTDFEEDEPELILDEEDDAPEPQDGDDDEPDDEPADKPPEDGDEHDVVGWGEEEIAAEPETESVGMRNLREELKRQRQRVKELEQRTAPKIDEVGEKPNLDDFWDRPDEYDAAYEAWLERKRAAKQRDEQKETAARRQQDIWERQRGTLDTRFAELRVPGKDEARALVEEEFPGELYAYLVKAGGDNAAALMIGLGRSAEKRATLKKLAEEGSLAEFIREAAIMSTEVRVGPRKPVTAPERQHGGMSGGAARGDAKRARLERDAEKSGDFSALVKYDKQMESRR